MKVLNKVQYLQPRTTINRYHLAALTLHIAQHYNRIARYIKTAGISCSFNIVFAGHIVITQKY